MSDGGPFPDVDAHVVDTNLFIVFQRHGAVSLLERAANGYVVDLDLLYATYQEPIANELDDDGITVTVLIPAETDTAILEKGRVQDSALPENALLSAQEVAQRGYDGLRRGVAHSALGTAILRQKRSAEYKARIHHDKLAVDCPGESLIP